MYFSHNQKLQGRLQDRRAVQAADRPGDAVIINSNFAIDAKLSPVKDSIALEDSESPYANLIAVRPADKDFEKMKAYHIGQKQDSPLAELTHDEHKGNYRLLHEVPPQTSQINRRAFAKEKANY